jgi:carbon-monoxide dehydrogenase iron sulfur subunit
MSYIEVDPGKCTACRLCEFYCSLHHFGEVNPSKSRIRVQIISKQFYYHPVVCRQCGNAPCVESCPKDAISLNESTGALEIVEENCIGCKMCVKACPFGAMGFVKESKLANKCDLCGGDPQCVAHCYYGALQLTDGRKVSEAMALGHAERELQVSQLEVK